MNKSLKLIPGFIAALLISCGGGEDNKTSSPEENGNETETTETTTPPGESFADVVALADKNAFTAKEFSRMTVFLYQKEATVMGYPYAYPNDTEVEFKPNSTKMIDDLDNSSAKVEVKVKFKDGAETKTLEKGKLFAVKGKLDVGYTISESWGNTTYITVYDAEYVEAASDPQKLTTIADLDLNKPVHSADLFQVMNSHYEKIYNKDAVKITGDYQQTNTSTTSYGKTYDVVLGSEAQVHCEMKEAPDNDALKAKREEGKQITVSGKFGGCSYTPDVVYAVFL